MAGSGADATVDPSRGYESCAAEFLAGRDRARDGIGAATVRTWARTLRVHGAVLDLGCGSGIPNSRVLIDAGLRVCAVDASPTLVAAFEQTFPGIPTACEPAETSTFFDRTFDGILAWGLLFLLPSDTQQRLLRRAARALAAGGRLLFTAPRQPCRWIDALTAYPSESLGADVYREILRGAGLDLIGEFDDEGENHYYDAVRWKAETSRPPAPV